MVQSRNWFFNFNLQRFSVFAIYGQLIVFTDQNVSTRNKNAGKVIEDKCIQIKLRIEYFFIIAEYTISDRDRTQELCSYNKDAINRTWVRHKQIKRMIRCRF